MSADPYDYRWLLARLARNSRTLLQQARLDHWQEDVCQEAALNVFALHSRGKRVGRKSERLCVLAAVASMFHHARKGGPRMMMEQHAAITEDLSASVGGDSGARAIALWRLQALWPTLTPAQQQGIFDAVVGNKISTASSTARRQAAKHLDTHPSLLGKVGRSKGRA